MKPHESKIWIPADDKQIQFLEYIRNEFRNGRYKKWNSPTIPIIDHRLKTVSNVIKNKGYYQDTSVHRTLINIRNEYSEFIIKKWEIRYKEETTNPCAEIFMGAKHKPSIQFD